MIIDSLGANRRAATSERLSNLETKKAYNAAPAAGDLDIFEPNINIKTPPQTSPAESTPPVVIRPKPFPVPTEPQRNPLQNLQALANQAREIALLALDNLRAGALQIFEALKAKINAVINGLVA